MFCLDDHPPPAGDVTLKIDTLVYCLPLSVCLFVCLSVLPFIVSVAVHSHCQMYVFMFRPTTPVLTTVCSRKPYQLFKVKSSYYNHSFRLVWFCRKEGPLCFQDKDLTIATVALVACIITVWYAIPCFDTLTLDFKAMLVVLYELQIHKAVLLFCWPSSKTYYEFLDRFPHCKQRHSLKINPLRHETCLRHFIIFIFSHYVELVYCL